MTESREARLTQAKAEAARNRTVPVIRPNKGYPLEVRLQGEVITYIDLLEDGLFVVMDICHHLIESHGATKETYMSGKLKLYPLVCMYLDQLAKEGYVAVIDEQETYYKIVSFSGEPKEEPRLQEKKKETAEEAEPAQLSLF